MWIATLWLCESAWVRAWVCFISLCSLHWTRNVCVGLCFCDFLFIILLLIYLRASHMYSQTWICLLLMMRARVDMFCTGNYNVGYTCFWMWRCNVQFCWNTFGSPSLCWCTPNVFFLATPLVGENGLGSLWKKRSVFNFVSPFLPFVWPPQI